MPDISTALIVVLVILLLVVVVLVFNFLGLWIQALFSGAHVGLLSMVGMRIRRVNPRLIVT